MKPTIIAPDFDHEWNMIKKTALKEAEDALPEWKDMMLKRKKKEIRAIVLSAIIGLAIAGIPTIISYMANAMFPIVIIASIMVAIFIASHIYVELEPNGYILSQSNVEKYYAAFSKRLAYLKNQTSFQDVYNTWKTVYEELRESYNFTRLNDLRWKINELAIMYEICNCNILNYSVEHEEDVTIEYANEKGVVDEMYFDCISKTSINVTSDTFTWEDGNIVLLKKYQEKTNQ